MQKRKRSRTTNDRLRHLEDLKGQVRSLEKKREGEQARADGANDELEEVRAAAQRREKELKDELA